MAQLNPDKLNWNFLNDTEAELALFRDTETMNMIANQIRDFSFDQLEDKLTEQELKRCVQLIPGTDNSTRKRMIISWLRENPAMMTVDPLLLYQRFFLYKRHMGAASKTMDPPQPKPLHTTTVKLRNIIQLNNQAVTERKEMLKKAQAQQEAQRQAQEAQRQAQLQRQAQVQKGQVYMNWIASAFPAPSTVSKLTPPKQTQDEDDENLVEHRFADFI